MANQLSAEAEYLAALGMTVWGFVLILLNRRIGALMEAMWVRRGPGLSYRSDKSGSYPIVWGIGIAFAIAGIAIMIANIMATA
jgi:hypothetical protein